MSPTLRLAVSGVRRRGWIQVLVLVLVTGLASAAVVAGLASRTSTADLVDAAYEQANHPDLVLRGTDDALRAVADDPAVAAASEPAPRTFGETTFDGDTVDVIITATDPDALPAVGAPELVDGRWPTADDEVVVERSVALEGVTSVGDTLTVTNPNGDFELQVVGTAIELSDCFYLNGQCDPLRVFGPAQLVERMDARITPDVWSATYRLVDPDEAAAVGARLLRDSDGITSQNTWPDTRGDILVIGEVFGALVGGFGMFLLVAACFVVAGATAARLVARRRSLGLLRAVGFRRRQLTAAVLFEHVIIGAAGVVLGWVLGSLLAPALGEVDAVLDTNPSTFELRALIVAFLLVEALLALAVVIPAWRAGQQPATEVLRDVPPLPNGGSAIASLVRHLGAGPSTVAGVRRTFARPVRAGLAGAAILVAVVGAVTSAGFISGVNRAVDEPATVGEPWDAEAFTIGHAVGDAADAEARFAAVLDDTPEVAAWYTDRESTLTVDDAGYSTRILGGDPAAADFRMGEGRRPTEAGEAMVGYGFLQETDLDVSDVFAADFDGQTAQLRIVGWYYDTTDGGKVVTIREETLPGGVDGGPTFRLVAADGVDRDELAAAVAARTVGTAVVVPGSFDDGGFSAISGTLILFAQLLAGVAFANLVATTMAGTRERARALGVLRTVGCTTRQLVGQSAVGNGLLGLAAGLLGVPLGWLVFSLLSDGITRGAGIGPGLAPAPSLGFMLLLVPAAALLAAAAGAVASVGLARRPAAELVRYE